MSKGWSLGDTESIRMRLLFLISYLQMIWFFFLWCRCRPSSGCSRTSGQVWEGY